MSAEGNFFMAYHMLTTLTLKMTTRSPLRVGAGKGYEIGEPDLPILRTPTKEAVIPGSSVKGVVRNNLARFMKRDTSSLVYIFGGETPDDEHIGSSIIFGDLVSERPIPTSERAHIQINLQTGGVENLFNVEYVPENTIFTGKIISRNTPLTTLSGILHVMNFLLDAGVARVGGFKSRGYGLVKLDLVDVEVLVPSRDFSYNTRITLDGKNEEVRVKVLEKEMVVTHGGEYRFAVKGIKDGLLYSVKLDAGDFLSKGREVIKNWR